VSALGHKRTFRDGRVTSAFLPKADIGRRTLLSIWANLNQSFVELSAIWWRHFNRVGVKFRYMTRRLADVMIEVLDELGADEAHPLHASVFKPIIERRWSSPGNNRDSAKDFRQTINTELRRFGPRSTEWTPKLFRMHGGGYWSVRNDAPRAFEQQWRKEVEELCISIHT